MALVAPHWPPLKLAAQVGLLGALRADVAQCTRYLARQRQLFKYLIRCREVVLENFASSLAHSSCKLASGPGPLCSMFVCQANWLELWRVRSRKQASEAESFTHTQTLEICPAHRVAATALNGGRPESKWCLLWRDKELRPK